MKRYLYLLFVTVLAQSLHAQRYLSLDSCRTLALTNNKDLRMAREKVTAAHYQQKATFTQFLPKLELTGGYLYTHREISLLSDEQKDALGNLGSNAGQSLQQWAASHPLLAELLQPLSGLLPSITQSLDGVGQSIANAFHTDTRHLYTGAAVLTQPLYMGGKIAAYHQLTRYAEQLAGTQQATQLQEVILQTDQAYWQVISLANKKRLAESYLELVEKLESDVTRLKAQGLATKADELSVKVKVNEAEMTLTQVDNGLSLAKMVLCQLCGLPLETPLKLADEEMKDLPLPSAPSETPVAIAFANRSELKSLELAEKIYRQKIRIARSEFLPTVALSASYLLSNPSLVNGFEKKFNGLWSIGVMVKVPVFHWGEGNYKVRAAKAEANIARYQWEAAKEKVELQVTQSSYKVNEAAKRLTMALQNMEKAEENLKYAHLSFREGVIPTSNVLEAQTAWLSAQSAKIDAQIEVRLSEVYLKKALGVL